MDESSMVGEHQLWAIVPAAGVGRRMGDIIPKQYMQLAGVTILERSLQKLFDCQEIDHAYVVLHPDDDRGLPLLLAFGDRVTIVPGGAERADSVLQGLLAMRSEAAADDWVLIHDAARPCVRSADINLLLKMVKAHPVGGLLGEPVTDTLKRVTASHNVESTLSRDNLWRAYTPQVFRYGLLYQAMEAALEVGVAITDEASAMEFTGHSPLMVEGHSDNIKITRPEDLILAELFLQHQLSTE